MLPMYPDRIRTRCHCGQVLIWQLSDCYGSSTVNGILTKLFLFYIKVVWGSSNEIPHRYFIEVTTQYLQWFSKRTITRTDCRLWTECYGLLTQNILLFLNFTYCLMINKTPSLKLVNSSGDIPSKGKPAHQITSGGQFVGLLPEGSV